MRAALYIAVALGLALSPAVADAKPPHSAKRVTTHEKSRKSSGRVAVQTDKERATSQSASQSAGKAWEGSLHHSSQLKAGKRYLLRRPWRTYGTRTAVRFVAQVVRETLADLPKVHDLAIGDMSEENGGQISGHHSHRSGRDIDIGLFYKSQPNGYPANFVLATEQNLNRSATWRLIVNFASTANDDGGVQVMFLDFKVQGIIYKWAKANGVSEARLDKIFQYPHGRDSHEGLIHHVPNHGDHIHVRFKCASTDTGCEP